MALVHQGNGERPAAIIRGSNLLNFMWQSWLEALLSPQHEAVIYQDLHLRERVPLQLNAAQRHCLAKYCPVRASCLRAALQLLGWQVACSLRLWPNRLVNL